MTRNELYELLKKCGRETARIHTLDKIWGQPFDGETEKITPQPISTAPKGERILLYCRPIESEGWWQIGMMCPYVHHWIDDDYEPDWMITQPTYWLPLPPTPTQPQ